MLNVCLHQNFDSPITIMPLKSITFKQQNKTCNNIYRYVCVCVGVCVCVCVCPKSLQLCPTLCDPLDSNLPGSSVHGILSATILEMPFSRDLPDPGIKLSSPVSPALKVDSLLLSHQGSYIYMHISLLGAFKDCIPN